MNVRSQKICCDSLRKRNEAHRGAGSGGERGGGPLPRLRGRAAQDGARARPGAGVRISAGWGNFVSLPAQFFFLSRTPLKTTTIASVEKGTAENVRYLLEVGEMPVRFLYRTFLFFDEEVANSFAGVLYFVIC